MAEVIGSYTLHETLGEGGMGIVYRATQEKPVRRTVALKVLKAGMDSKNLIARFESERQALALMDHPGVAKIFDFGETATGRPYFVMEVVTGHSIVDYCRENGLSQDAKLELFAEVCRAVEHAHQKGIIHRDLKPSNILVHRDSEGRGIPKIIDFGIAKAMAGNDALTDRTLFTQYLQILGTPAYMAPEQLDISGIDIDTRTDIYALGVLLYQLLAGQLPFASERLQKASATELEQILHEEDPPKPSKHVASLSGDLDWIIMKALEKDPAQRYDSVGKLREDVLAHRRDDPVSARPPAAGYLIKKYFRRHRIAISFAITVLALLLAGIGVSTWQAIRATRAERAEEDKGRLALQRLQASDAMLDFITLDMLGQARPSEEDDRDVKLTTVLDGAAAKVNDKFKNKPRIRCFMNLRLGSIYENLGRYDEADTHTNEAKQAWRELTESIEEGNLVDVEEIEILDADITYQFASNRIACSDFETAIPYLKEALAKNLAIRGPQAKLVAEIHEYLGFSYHGLGKPREAVAELTKAERLYTEHHPDQLEARVITLAATLALAHEELGNPEEANAYLEKTLSLLRDLKVREKHPLRISTMNNLALVYMRRNEPEKALPLLEQALALVEEIFGKEHVRMAKTAHSLGACYVLLKRYEDAYPHYQFSWEQHAKYAGAGNEWTLIFLRDLVQCAAFLGRREDQARYLDQMIDETHKNFGDNHYLMKVALDSYNRLWSGQPEKIDELHKRLTGEEPWPLAKVRALLPKGSNWHYHTGSHPPSDWHRPEFDPDVWPKGAAPLGYGESDIVTVIPEGSEPNKKWAASFFVTDFAADLSEIPRKLRVRVRRDDGIAVYLNGKEILRDGLPEDAAWDNYATREIGGLEEQLYYVTELDPSLLKQQNRLTAQVHQCNEGSSDVFFDLAIEALVP